MFAFSALLKRQFLLCKRKIFTLILTFFILYAIYGIMLFSGDSVDIMKFETANLVFKMVFSVILTTSFVTTLVDDLRKKSNCSFYYSLFRRSRKIRSSFNFT